MSRGKPGMGKYQGFRGPHPGEREARAKWLKAEADYDAKFLAEATAANDPAQIRLARRQAKETQALVVEFAGATGGQP